MQEVPFASFFEEDDLFEQSMTEDFFQGQSNYSFYQCCGSGMFIPDPGSEFYPSWIRIKEFKYFNPKHCF
jgi:hypothetical protein